MSTRSQSSRPERSTRKPLAPVALKRRQTKTTSTSSKTHVATNLSTVANSNVNTSTREHGVSMDDSGVTTDVYVVDQILKRDKFDRSWMCLVSWVGYDDVTWEPEKNIPPAVVKNYKAVAQHHSNCTCAVKKCLDMVDCSRNGNDELWLCQVSWTKCSHTTWELESNIDPSIVAAFRRFSSDVVESKSVFAEVKLAEVEECATCGKPGGLGRPCGTCKRPMHHFCANDVCASMDLTNNDGSKMVDFPNDARYCSSACYYSTDTTPPITRTDNPKTSGAKLSETEKPAAPTGGASGKKRRAPIYSDSSGSDTNRKRRASIRNDFSDSDEDYTPAKMKAMSTLKRQTMPLVQIAPKVSAKQVPKIAKKRQARS
jgi:hypothetical protein